MLYSRHLRKEFPDKTHCQSQLPQLRFLNIAKHSQGTWCIHGLPTPNITQQSFSISQTLSLSLSDGERVRNTCIWYLTFVVNSLRISSPLFIHPWCHTPIMVSMIDKPPNNPGCSRSFHQCQVDLLHHVQSVARKLIGDSVADHFDRPVADGFFQDFFALRNPWCNPWWNPWWNSWNYKLDNKPWKTWI